MKPWIEKKLGIAFGHFVIFDNDYLFWFRLGAGSNLVALELGGFGHGFYLSRA